MKNLLLLFAVFISVQVSAQTTLPLKVKGVIIDSATNQPLGFVTVALLDAKTKQPIRGVLSKDDGTFELQSVTSKAYQLEFASLGYTSKILNINGTDTLFNVGRILLSSGGKQLKEVAISAQKPIMKQEVDRISYNVQNDPESPVLSALDIMRKVPLLAVDAADNILLKGSGNYKIFINGKESGLLAKNPSDILKSMPATNIEKIEVITTPPAKYDAEGLSGIINIITKRNLAQGYNVSINGRENSVFGPGISFNPTYKTGKVGISLLSGFSHNGQPELPFGSTQTFSQQNSVLQQSGTNKFSTNSNYITIETSYEIDSLKLLTAQFDAYGNSVLTNVNQLSSLMNSLGVTSQFYNLQNNETDNSTGYDAAVNYQLGFRHKKGRLLTLSYKYIYSPDKDVNNNSFPQRINYPQLYAPDYEQFNTHGSKVHTFQVDYEQPFKTVIAEAGAKAILRDNFSEYHVDDLDSATNKYVTNSAQTNDFNYYQNVYSIYNTYQLNTKEWSVKAGLRLEHTNVNADFASTGSTVHEDYTNFIPSVSLQRKFKTSSMNFGYTERIQRPGINQVNPFINRSNPSYINFGNPGLRPELNHTFELTYSNFTKGSVIVGFNYSFSNNSIQTVSGLQITNIGGKIDSVSTTTYQNLGTNSTLGFNINITENIVKNLSLSTNGVLNYIRLQGDYNGQLYKNQGFYANLSANVSYSFGSGYRIGTAASFLTGNITLQGKSGNSIYLSPVITKSFLNKKATIGLAVNNPFSPYQTIKSTLSTNQYYTSSFSQSNFRSFGVRFNYRFGKLSSELKKSKHEINNDDTKGSAN